MKRWIRTCQECGAERIYFQEPSQKTLESDAYCNAACPKCKSEALDYGSMQYIEPLTEQDKKELAQIEKDMEEL